MEDGIILDVKDLNVAFHKRDGSTYAVNGISYTLHEGETLGVVGESGCGKTVSSMSLLKLISMPPGKIEAGSAIYNGDVDLIKLSNKQLRPYRGREIAVIFQDPMTAFNQVMTIGDQMIEGYVEHFRCSRAFQVFEERSSQGSSAIDGNDRYPRSRNPAERLSKPIFWWNETKGDDCHGSDVPTEYSHCR